MSIRRQMILVFGLVALLPLAAAAIFALQFNRVRLERAAKARLAAEARRVSTEVDSFFRRQTENTRQAGLLPALTSVFNGPAGASLEHQTQTTKLLLSVIVDDPVNVSSCAVLDLQGRNLIDIAPGLQGRSEAEAAWWREPIRTGLPYADVTFLAGEPPALYFSAPIRNTYGEVVGVLRTRYELAVLRQIISQAVETAAQRLVAALFDHRGRMFVQTEGFRPDFEPTLERNQFPPLQPNPGTEGFWTRWSQAAATRQERDRGIAVATRNMPWFLAVAETESDFAAPVRELTRTFLGFGILTVALVVTAVLLMARRLSHPVVELAQVVRRGAEGDLAAVAGENFPGEVGTLARDYNRLSERLRHSLAELQQRIAEVQATEELMRELVAASPVASFVYRSNFTIEQVNRKFTELFGYGPAQMRTIEDWWRQAYPDPAYRASVQQLLRDRIKEAGPDQSEIRPFDAVVTCANGRRVQVEFHRRTLGDRVLVVAIDMTAHKQALEALQANEERYRLLHEHAPDAVFVYDADQSRLIDCNPAAERLFKYPRERLLDPTRPSISPPVQPDGRTSAVAGAAYIEAALAGKNPVYVWAYVDADQRRLDCEVRLMRFPDPHGRRLVRGSIVDISERTRAEERQRQLEGQLRQSQKMEAIGTLAGGIAHDFNNILAGILGNLEIAMQSAALPDSTRSLLEAANTASLRARDLVSQILTFSRRREQHLASQQLAPIVKEVEALLRASLPATIRIETKIDPDLRSVRCDAGQIHQVIMNLGTNAAHAMLPVGGVLTIGLDEPTTVAVADRERLRSLAGRALRLTVRDTGVGMAPAVRERIFEPFFTTKPIGEGSGLGLSVVHGIVEDHGGFIKVESTPGVGSVFEVWLPAAATEERGNHAKTEPLAETPLAQGAGQRVLIVDDEPAVAAVGERMLTMLGYTPIKFTDAAAGLAEFRRDPSQFGALVSDLTMPGITGTELVREARALRPDLPVVILTGYMRPLEIAQIKALGVTQVVTKPFTVSSLGEAMRLALKAS